MEDEIKLIDRIKEGPREYCRYENGSGQVIDVNKRPTIVNESRSYSERVLDPAEKILFQRERKINKGDFMYTFVQRQPQLLRGNVFISKYSSNGERILEATRRAFDNVPKHSEESGFYQPPPSKPKEIR